MFKSRTLWLAVLILAGVSTAGMAQATAKQGTKSGKAEKKVVMKEQSPGLLAKAKITADEARKSATAKVGGETVSKEEIRQENGKLVYTFWFKKPKSGVDAVDVDANTGSAAAPRHESKTAAKAERKGTSSTKTSKKS